MNNYRPFLIQKLTDNAPVRDSKEWNIWIKSVPFKLSSELQNITSRTWLDEHGDEEFYPENPTYKAYEIDCQFVYIGSYESANTQIKSFRDYLVNGGMFKFYNSYTKIGRTKVRYVKIDNDMFHRREGDEDVVLFTVSLKVNDPITDIILTKTT